LGLDNIITKFDNIQNEVQKATQKDKYTALLSYFDDDKINYNELLTFIKTHESCIAKINEAEYKKIMDTNKKNEIIQMAYRMLSDVYCCTINNKIQMYPFYKVPDEYNDLYYLIDYSKDLYDGKDTVEINISNQWLKNIILHDIKDDIVKKINMIKDYLRSVEQQNSTSEIKSKPLRNNIDSIFNFQYITFKLESEGLLSALNN
jgi:hypothetical protein